MERTHDEERRKSGEALLSSASNQCYHMTTKIRLPNRKMKHKRNEK
jgi:hypothetical protein